MTQTCRACHEPTKDKLWSHYCKACHKAMLKEVAKARRKNRKRHKEPLPHIQIFPEWISLVKNGVRCNLCEKHVGGIHQADEHLELVHGIYNLRGV